MVVLGRILAPYGVRGWLKIHPLGDDPESWCGMPQWWLGLSGGDGDWQPYSLEAFRPHASGWIAKFVGIDDRTGAEMLDGWYVGAPREALPQTEQDEYYWSDLIGLSVRNSQDELLGTVDTLIETGAHQVLVVKDGETKRLLPFVDQVVKEVDVGERVVRVDWGMDW
jgi:16S rRNA processing protein RimM